MDKGGPDDGTTSPMKRSRKRSPPPVPPTEQHGSEPEATESALGTNQAPVAKESEGQQEGAKALPKGQEHAVLEPVSAGEKELTETLPTNVKRIHPRYPQAFLEEKGASSSRDVLAQKKLSSNISEGATASTGAAEPWHTANVGLDILEDPKIQLIFEEMSFPKREGLEKMRRFLLRWRQGHEILKKVHSRLRTGLTGPVPSVSAPDPVTSPEAAADIPRVKSAPSQLAPLQLAPSEAVSAETPSTEAGTVKSDLVVICSLCRSMVVEQKTRAVQTEEGVSSRQPEELMVCDEKQPENITSIQDLEILVKQENITSTQDPKTSVMPEKGSSKVPEWHSEHGAFKRPVRVSSRPPLPLDQGPSTSSASMVPRSPQKRRRSEEERVPVSKSSDATLEKLKNFSALVHREHPSLFPAPDSALDSILNIRDSIENEYSAPLDSLCTHHAYNVCWLLKHEGALNEVLVLHNLEIVELDSHAYTLRRLGRREEHQIYAKAAIFDSRLEAMVMWLLRIHRCIKHLSLDLAPIAKSPSDFCGAFSLHKDYKSIDLGFSWPVGKVCPKLNKFLSALRNLEELSLYGIYALDGEDADAIHEVLLDNEGIRKLSLQDWYMPHRYLCLILSFGPYLPNLQEVVVSAARSTVCKDEEAEVENVLNKRHAYKLKKVCIDIDTSYKALFQRLPENQYITELEITDKLVMAADLIPLSKITGKKNVLRRLVISLDMQAVLKDQSYEEILIKLVKKAALDVLKFVKTTFTKNGIYALAEGLGTNGKSVTLATSEPSAKSTRKPMFLKELHLRGKNLGCGELQILLLEGLLRNKHLQVLDVGLIYERDRSLHLAVTKAIVDDVTETLLDKAARLEENPTAPFRLVKHHFPPELLCLISAVRREITFKELSFVFVLNSDDNFGARRKEFGHLLAILPYYATQETLESVSIESTSYGMPDVGALGLAMLAFMSTTLVNLSVSFGGSCSEITTILLFEGLANSVSIRSLEMSECSLKSPAPLFFEHMCKTNKSLERMHIHVKNIRDESNAAFIAHLPAALCHMSSLLEFSLTRGRERKEIFIHKVQAVLRRNQRMFSCAAKLVQDVGTEREMSRGPGGDAHLLCLTLPLCINFQRVENMTVLRDCIIKRTGWSILKVNTELNITKNLVAERISKAMRENAKPQEGGTSTAEEADIGDFFRGAQNVFEIMGVRGTAPHTLQAPYDERYQERLGVLSRAIKDIYYEEQERFAMQYKTLQGAVESIVQYSPL